MGVADGNMAVQRAMSGDDREQETAILLARARAGDAQAFRALYDAHAAQVYALCLRLSADPAVAVELTQDTFVRVWRSLSAFAGASALGTWIHRIAVNVVLERRRTDQRRSARVASVHDDTEQCVAGRAVPLDARLDLEAALRALPATPRLIFVLREIEGYPYAEISALTGLSEVALRSHVYRARRRLMELLAR